MPPEGYNYNDLIRRVNANAEFTKQEVYRILAYETGVPAEVFEARMAVICGEDLLMCPEDL